MPQRFPGLHLAWAALRGPEGSTTVLNAANEVAVAAFLDRQHRLRRDSPRQRRHHRLPSRRIWATCRRSTTCWHWTSRRAAHAGNAARELAR